jgi:hypothetical protein
MDFNTIHNTGSVEIEVGNPMRDEYMNLIRQPKQQQQDYTMNPANFRPGAYHEKPGQSSASTSNRNSHNSTNGQYQQPQQASPHSPTQYDPTQYFHHSQYGGFNTEEIGATGSTSQYPFQNPTEQQHHQQHHQYQPQQQHHQQQQQSRYSHNSHNSHHSQPDPHPVAEGGPIAAITSDGVNDDDSFYEVDQNEN